jgi:hypothetical protein
MVTPVVLITTGGILVAGLLEAGVTLYNTMQRMTREQLDIRTGPRGELLDTGRMPAACQEQLEELDWQLPRLLRQYRLLRNALLLIYAGIASLVLSVISIGVAVTESSEVVGAVALGLVLAGGVVVFAGIVAAARSLARGPGMIAHAVERTRTLDSRQAGKNPRA